MKNFMFTESGVYNRRTGGTNVTAQIYRIVKNTPEWVAEIKWNTASFKGPESTVMNVLAFKGEIPRQFTEGYYSHNNGKFLIHRI